MHCLGQLEPSFPDPLNQLLCDPLIEAFVLSSQLEKLEYGDNLINPSPPTLGKSEKGENYLTNVVVLGRITNPIS